jgi:hypothetical protein
MQDPGHVRLAAPVPHLLRAVGVVTPEAQHVAVERTLVQQWALLGVDVHAIDTGASRLVRLTDPAPDTAQTTPPGSQRQRRKQAVRVARDPPHGRSLCTTRAGLHAHRLSQLGRPCDDVEKSLAQLGIHADDCQQSCRRSRAMSETPR